MEYNFSNTDNEVIFEAINGLNIDLQTVRKFGDLLYGENQYTITKTQFTTVQNYSFGQSQNPYFGTCFLGMFKMKAIANTNDQEIGFFAEYEAPNSPEEANLTASNNQNYEINTPIYYLQTDDKTIKQFYGWFINKI